MTSAIRRPGCAWAFAVAAKSVRKNTSNSVQAALRRHKSLGLVLRPRSIVSGIPLNTPHRNLYLILWRGQDEDLSVRRFLDDDRASASSASTRLSGVNC